MVVATQVVYCCGVVHDVVHVVLVVVVDVVCIVGAIADGCGGFGIVWCR
jgi:hypothetical protein